MSKKEKNMKNVDEKDIKKADNEAADTTTDANAANTDNKDADTVETQGSSDADVKEDTQSDNASDAKGAEETVDINNNKKDQKDAVIEDLNDRLKRQMAEFDNYRKRTDKEKSAMFEMGASDVIKKLLPIVDNFERGFKSVTEEELQTPFAKGMDAPALEPDSLPHSFPRNRYRLRETTHRGLSDNPCAVQIHTEFLL